MRCAIFHRNTNLLIIWRNVNIFTQVTLHPSIISGKKWRSPLQTFFETSTFYHLFTIFKRFVIFEVNADFLINQLTKYFYRSVEILYLHDRRHLTLLRYSKKFGQRIKSTPTRKYKFKQLSK